MTDTTTGAEATPMPADHRTGRRLVVPAGWVIDDAARDRLERHLDRAPGDVTGIVAEVDDLPAGASYRTHAEWRSLDPERPVEYDSTDVHGAVLLRPGVGFTSSGDLIRVANGPLLVDRGAHVHDPHRGLASPGVASEFGRSPFPRRPTVVFAAHEIDTALGDWARRLTNRLVRRDVEARLAIPGVPDGLHLTQPCSPGRATILALSPDVVVTLDDETSARVDEWCEGFRSTVVIHFRDDTSLTSAPVPWQLGRASGRVRGVIGRRADAPGLAALVRRLSVGPQPMPPAGVRAPGSGPSSSRGTSAPRTARRASPRVAFVAPSSSNGVSSRLQRLDGLRDQLHAVGARVSDATPESSTDDVALEADLVVVSGVEGPGVRELVTRRLQEDRPTVADVSTEDVVTDAQAADPSPALDPAVTSLVVACGRATSPGGAVATLLHDLDAVTHALPSVLTRGRFSELREARSIHGFDAMDDPVVRWYLGTSDLPVAPYVDVVAEALAALLAGRPDLHVEAVVDDPRLPGALRDHDRVTTAGPAPAPDELLRWVVHLWTPPTVGGTPADDMLHIAEASCSGVPSAMATDVRSAVDGHVPSELVVEDPYSIDQWADALECLADDDQRRIERSREAFRQSNTVQGPTASKVAVQRFLGWAHHGGEL